MYWWRVYLRGVLDISLANTFPSCVIRTNLFAHLENKWTWSRLQIDPAITTWENKAQERNEWNEMKWNTIKCNENEYEMLLKFNCVCVLIHEMSAVYSAWLFRNLFSLLNVCMNIFLVHFGILHTRKHARKIIENHVAHTFNLRCAMTCDTHPAGTWTNRFWRVATHIHSQGMCGKCRDRFTYFSPVLLRFFLAPCWHINSSVDEIGTLSESKCVFWCSIFRKSNETQWNLDGLLLFLWNEIEQPHPLNSLLAHVKLQGTQLL